VKLFDKRRYRHDYPNEHCVSKILGGLPCPEGALYTGLERGGEYPVVTDMEERNPTDTLGLSELTAEEYDAEVKCG
jgi:hypothetical protein